MIFAKFFPILKMIEFNIFKDTNMQEKILSQAKQDTYDTGLRAYMQKIYNFMAIGLCITALSSWLVANTSLIKLFFTITPESATLSGLGWLALIAPLIMVFAFSWVVQKGTPQQAQILFWSYAAIMGISLAPIFLLYTGSSITRVFLISAGAFGGLSLWGYTTTRDLTGMGTFLRMGLWGLIIAMIVNIFLKSSGFDWALSIIGVVIFSGLTAYDTQNLKNIYHSQDNGETITKKAIMGALQLYLDFINLFIYLLRFFGERRQ